MNRRKVKSGFTLVEVTIAAVIGSFIAMVAVGSLRMASSARDRVEQHLAVSDELRFAANLIRRDLQNLYRDADYGRMRFVGTIVDDMEPVSGRLNLKTVSGVNARPQCKEGDVYVVEYFLMQQDEKTYLMRRYCPVVGHEEVEDTQGGIVMPVAENVLGFDIRYFDGAEWMLEWPDTEDKLPGLVEVTLTAGSGREDESDVMAAGFMVNFPRYAPSGQANEGAENEQQGQQNQGQEQGQQSDPPSQSSGQNSGGSSRGGSQQGGSGGGGRGSGGMQRPGSGRDSGSGRQGGGRGSSGERGSSGRGGNRSGGSRGDRNFSEIRTR